MSGEEWVDGVEPLVELLLAGRLHQEAALLRRDAERALGQGLRSVQGDNVGLAVSRPLEEDVLWFTF